jgi:hypothetical protein
VGVGGGRVQLGAVVVALAAALAGRAPALAAGARAAGSSGGGAVAALVEQRPDGVEIDWRDGTLTARGGAAADLSLPSADLARPGAVRRARAAALARIKEALADLPAGGVVDGAGAKGRHPADAPARRLAPDAISRALDRARTLGIDYQSNGGALVRVQVRFTDWLAPEEPPEGPALAVREMRLGAAPLVHVGGREVAVGAARYHLGEAPAGAHAVAAKVDREGRLAIAAGDRALGEKLAGAAIVIYVEKVLK